MRTHGSLTAGWLDTTVAEILQHGGQLFAAFGYALVTSVDSVPDLSKTSLATDTIDHCGGTLLGDGLVIPWQYVPRVAGELRGFDEVWCFRGKPTLPKPTGVSLVGPWNVDEQGLPPLLEAWIIKSACELGLADGVGMNYVTPHRDVGLGLERLMRTLNQGTGS